MGVEKNKKCSRACYKFINNDGKVKRKFIKIDRTFFEMLKNKRTTFEISK